MTEVRPEYIAAYYQLRTQLTDAPITPHNEADAAIGRLVDEVRRHDADSGPFPHGFARVQGRCPACRMSALFLGEGGYVTCGNLQCTDPCAATEMLERP
jgi:hypothetical protein